MKINQNIENMTVEKWKKKNKKKVIKWGGRISQKLSEIKLKMEQEKL